MTSLCLPTPAFYTTPSLPLLQRPHMSHSLKTLPEGLRRASAPAQVGSAALTATTASTSSSRFRANRRPLLSLEPQATAASSSSSSAQAFASSHPAQATVSHLSSLPNHSSSSSCAAASSSHPFSSLTYGSFSSSSSRSSSASSTQSRRSNDALLGWITPEGRPSTLPKVQGDDLDDVASTWSDEMEGFTLPAKSNPRSSTASVEEDRPAVFSRAFAQKTHVIRSVPAVEEDARGRRGRA